MRLFITQDTTKRASQEQRLFLSEYLLALPRDTVLSIGETAKIQVTGLRNPCKQLDGIQSGLMRAVLDKDEEGNLIRKSGIMGIVLEGGVIRVDDKIQITLPNRPFAKLERV